MHWVFVVGSGTRATDAEHVAAQRVGRMLAREGYGLVSGTWGGVDKTVTAAFVDELGPTAAKRITHVENGRFGSRHRIRVGDILPGSFRAPFCPAAVDLASVGIVIGGHRASKRSMDALIERRKPVIPLAWLGHDGWDLLHELLASLDRHGRDVDRTRLIALCDPRCGSDRTVSRALGAVLCRTPDIFVSYHSDDSGAVAGRLAAELAVTYGSSRVFIDHASLPFAAPIDDVLSVARSSKVIVAVVGPTWRARVLRPGDYVRREIAAAQDAGAALLPVFAGATADQLDGVAENVKGVTVRIDDWPAVVRAVVGTVDARLAISSMHESPL